MNPSNPFPTPHIPVSWGELIDKITILQIKRERITDRAALKNVVAELAALDAIAGPILAGDEAMKNLAAQLKALNEILWDIEDRIRGKEAKAEFDRDFVELARAVYKRNDERGALKKKINLQSGSGLAEEKSYHRY